MTELGAWCLAKQPDQSSLDDTVREARSSRVAL